MKRKILTAILLTLILALSLFVVACGDDGAQGGAKYKVTVSYAATEGSVTVADESGKQTTEFGAGAKVVVTVSAADGYELDGFTVNGVAASLVDGVYKFDITANTAIAVTFKQYSDDGKTPEELFARAYTSVQTTFMAVGSYTYKEDGQDPHVNNVTTVFGDGAVNIIETDDETGNVLYDNIYVNRDGNLAEPYHTINNEIAYSMPDEAEPFADYDNPFKTLTTADFATTDVENVFVLTDAAKAKKAATAITGWVENIASFTVTIKDGKVTRINIVTELIKRGTGDDEYYYTSDYAFTLSGWGSAAVDQAALTPYATTAAHTALKNALKAASEAKNYTVHVFEQESGYEDLNYDVYVTETAIFDSCAGWESGYVEKKLNGDDDEMRVYSFRIGDEDDGEEKNGKVVIGDAVNYETVKAMRADFSGFAPEIFQNDGDVFTLQSDCINYTDDVLVHFADGADNIVLYRDYALSVQITLKDGKLYQVEMYYYVYGALVKRTVTYSEWDSTTMPISFDEWVKESVFDNYVGTYTDQKIVVKITTDGITVNNTPVVVTGYSATQQIFSGTYNGQECYIMYMSEKQLAVVIGNYSYVVTNIELDAVEIPEAYNGVWKDENANCVTVAYDKVMFGANMLKVLSYDENEGLVALRGDYTYRLILGELNGKTVLSVRALNSGMSSQTYVMSKVQNGFILPQSFVGTYAAFLYNVDYKVVVTLNGVTVQIGDKPYVATDVAVGTDGTKGTVITFKLNGASYSIAGHSYGADGIYLEGEGANVNLPRVEDDDPAAPPVVSVDIPEAFYGSYMYIDIPNKVFYSLYIDEDGIVAAVDMSSAEYVAEVLEFDEEYDFMLTVSINGKTYYLIGSVDNMTDDGKYNIITLMDGKEGEDGIEVDLLRDGYEGPSEGGEDTFSIPANFIGTYEGTKAGDDTKTKYVLTITSTGMTLKVGDAEPVKVTVKNYEIQSIGGSKRTKFTVIISGMGFDSIQYSGDASAIGDTLIQKIFLMGDGTVTFNRVAE
ncbi:MAG: hypothetical protein K2F90_03085 [Clostridiales bacterium]|nr:hypothetical protein [Clostridiales bacterium]